MHLINTQLVVVTGVYAYTLSGSITATILHNGSPVSGLTNITITSSPTEFNPTGPIDVNDLDVFNVSISALSSSPEGLAIGFLKTVTVTS